MNETSNNHAEPMTVEKLIHVSLCDARRGVHRQLLKCESRMQESPVSTVLSAVAVGCLLNRLPVRSILVTQFRILTALAPPTLFFLGAAKLYDSLQKRSTTHRDELSDTL